MRNRTLHVLAAFLLVFAMSCQNSGNRTNDYQNEESVQSSDVNASVKAQLETIEDRSNDLVDRISNATYAERKNLQDEVQNFVDETRERLTEMRADSELEQESEDMIDNIQDNINNLVEEGKLLSNKTEDEWKETTDNLNNKIRKIGEDIEDFIND